MTLFELWGKWVAATDIRNELLWGTSVLWWGIIGKILQLISAFMIIGELIGRERIANFLAALLGDKVFWWTTRLMILGSCIAGLAITHHIFIHRVLAKYAERRDLYRCMDSYCVDDGGSDHPIGADFHHP